MTCAKSTSYTDERSKHEVSEVFKINYVRNDVLVLSEGNLASRDNRVESIDLM
jgi:hypothetical protein